MTAIEAMDQFDRLLAAGFSLPSGADQASVFQEWSAAFVSVDRADVAAGISRLVTGRVDRFWPTIGELRGAIASATEGRERPGCRTCGGSWWVDAGPYTANGGHIYAGVRRCPDCGVPAPKVENRGQQTPLRGAELRAWEAAQRPKGEPIDTVEQFQARVRESALRMRVMPRVAKEVSHV